MFHNFYRPGVVQAVLRTELILIHKLTHQLRYVFPPHAPTPNQLKQGNWTFYTLFILGLVVVVF